MVKKFTALTVILLLVLALVACAPSTASKAQEKLEDKGYTVEVLTASDMREAFGGMDISANKGILAYNDSSEGYIMAIWFQDKESAEDFESIFKVAKNSLDFDEMDGEYGVKQKIFYFGNEQGIKDLF